MSHSQQEVTEMYDDVKEVERIDSYIHFLVNKYNGDSFITVPEVSSIFSDSVAAMFYEHEWEGILFCAAVNALLRKRTAITRKWYGTVSFTDAPAIPQEFVLEIEG